MASKLPHYALRIPQEIMDKLKVIADENGRSANKEIEQLIISHIKDYESDYGEISADMISRMYKKKMG